MPALKTPPGKKEKIQDPYAASFDGLEGVFSSRDPAWVMSLRKSGIAHFSDKGFPTSRDEEWRFTNISPIAKQPFRPILRATEVQESWVNRIAGFIAPHVAGPKLIFLNGHFSPTLSDLKDLPAGVTLMPLMSAITNGTQIVEKNLGVHIHCDTSAFIGLNNAFFQDGLFLHLAPNVKLDQPIQLLQLSTVDESGATSHPRNLIVLGHHAEAQLVETYASLAGASTCTNAVTEIVLEEGARLEHVKVQNENQDAFHIAMIQAVQARGSHYTSHSISIGSKIARNNIHTVFNGEGAECVMNGLYLGHNDQVVDHHTVIDHAKPNCPSHEFYHGILGGHARGVFNGKIFVRKDAQKTDAKQTNKCVLLSDTATIDTKPQLEIFADDVKCTHGATVGHLDEHAIFYLQARGIHETLARRMLIFAFASDILNRISHETVRDHISELVMDRLEKDYAEAGA